MNATVNSQKLAVELRLLNKIVPAKPAISILSHLLVKATPNGLHFYSTDLEIGLASDCEATVNAPGTITLPAEKFLSMVEQFPNDDVNIAADARGTVLVRCGAFKSKLQALPIDEYPDEPQPNGPSVSLNAEDLQRLITRTRFAVSPTEVKHVLRGALLKVAGAAVAMVATDGKKLAITTAACPPAKLEVIMPAGILDALVGQLDEGSVEVTTGTKHTFYTLGSRTFMSRVYDGTFPAYERVIPKENDRVGTFDRAAMSAALRRVLVAAEKNRAVYLGFDADSVEIATHSAEVGLAEESVPVEWSGEPLKVCINGDYVLDFLNAAQGRTTTVRLKDLKTAAVFSDGADYLAVVMLMRPGAK